MSFDGDLASDVRQRTPYDHTMPHCGEPGYPFLEKTAPNNSNVSEGCQQPHASRTRLLRSGSCVELLRPSDLLSSAQLLELTTSKGKSPQWYSYVQLKAMAPHGAPESTHVRFTVPSLPMMSKHSKLTNSSQ